MAFSNSMAVLSVLLVAVPVAAFVLDWPDNLAPMIAAEICKQVECGRGACKFDMNEPLTFTCECEPNWKRTFDGDDDLKFLPCVIPNCTLDYNCQPAPPSVPKKEVPHNLSAFDPCYWSYCGEGNCVRNSTYNYAPICECKSGSSNLLNVTAFPCYNECTLQPDCASLGIKVANSNSRTGSGNDSSQATSFLPGKFLLMAIVTVSVGMILRK
ncbi:hypothetical protein ACFX15_010149 [Malus domestica]|uniref:EGF-like domain-containing protein n=1 Tax=Malus domestica TaxID=3750 RepID=A0A498IJZ7_MALDO|nr:uncharacterized protein LOC103451019 [Malus domestica]RXH82417.1 hypothetical protein DVH24_036758 [Malus domestica]